MLSKGAKLGLAAGLMVAVGVGNAAEMDSAETLSELKAEEIARLIELAEMRLNIQERANNLEQALRLENELQGCAAAFDVCHERVVTEYFDRTLSQIALQAMTFCVMIGYDTNETIKQACVQSAIYHTAFIIKERFPGDFKCYDSKKACYKKIQTKWVSSEGAGIDL